MSKTQKYLLFKKEYTDQISHDTYEKDVKYGVKFEDESFYFTSSKKCIGIPKALEDSLYVVGFIQKENQKKSN